MTQAQLTLDGDTDVILRRHFTQPPANVWRALTEPALLRQWLSPDLTKCQIDARAGGHFRYDWPEFFFSGPILEADAPHHMVHVEHYNGDTTEGPTVTTTVTPDGTGTRMTVVMRYRDADARATATLQGFTDGIEMVFGRIEGLAFPVQAHGTINTSRSPLRLALLPNTPAGGTPRSCASFTRKTETKGSRRRRSFRQPVQPIHSVQQLARAA